MNLPPAIVFINADIDNQIRATLTTQLFLNEVMSDTEFDSRVSADPNYPINVHLQGLRILVVRQNYQDFTNRTLADVVIFVNQGQAVVEKNNFGPPGLSLPIARLNIYALLRSVGSSFVVILPGTSAAETEEDELEELVGIGGIVGEELSAGIPGSLVEDPDEDDNIDFINRN
jgi:hypothetical protein